MIIGGILYSQSVDEILGKYYEAMGGLDRLRTVKSIKKMGRYILVAQGGMEMSMTTRFSKSNKQERTAVRLFTSCTKFILALKK